VGASVGLALLRSNDPVTSADLERGGFEVDVAGDRYDITVSLTAPLGGG
jgi:4-methylaminobutanoate oxidase (formaldehyde-forming)